MASEYPLITLWEIARPQPNLPTFRQRPIAVRLTSSPPVRVDQLPFPRKFVSVSDLLWQCVGVEVAGVERTDGDVPTTRLRVQLNDNLRAEQEKNPPPFISGAEVIRYQCDVRAADERNWPRDPSDPNRPPVNPYTDTVKRVNYRIDRWIITRITNEDFLEVNAEMQNEAVFWKTLFRPEISGRCYHTYRDANCGYRGEKYWNAQNEPVTKESEDVCALSLKACELRFPITDRPVGVPPLAFGRKPQSLPFGGVPEEFGGSQ